MERDFSDQEHIFDCRRKFTFFSWDELLRNAPVVFPTGPCWNVLLALPLEATFTNVRGELQLLHLFPPPVSNWLPRALIS